MAGNGNLDKFDVEIPGAVREENRRTYADNFSKITHGTARLMLFAAAQKIEHLTKDFYGDCIASDDNVPDHSKTNLVKTAQKDPLSPTLSTVDDVTDFKESSGLNILGIGYTVYLGSEYEHIMLSEAAKAVFKAQQNGLISVLWVYPRGKAVQDEKDPHLIAGAAGVAACLGADFVKVNPPKKDGKTDPALLKEATLAVGKTRLVCAGGSADDPAAFFKRLYDQIHIGGTQGNATGRNIHQKGLGPAVKMCNAISAITLDDESAEKALSIYQG
jgi:fructose-bisphosphate aldolase/6-deoxy-5-ketofructose 1-phosphate synthase